MELLLHAPADVAISCSTHKWEQRAKQLIRSFGTAVSLVLSPKYDGQDTAHFNQLSTIASSLNISTVASATPVMHRGSRRRLSDVLTCVREGLQIDDIGYKALSNAERHMRNEAQMMHMFKGHEDAVHHSGHIAARCAFSLDELKYEYPS